MSGAKKCYIAHSLGNMVVSSMMQDYGLTDSIREYIVCNSAVPIEAYDTSSDAVNETTVNRMLPRAYSWYNQERIKGVKPFELGLGRNEGGWGFNSDYEVEDEYENDDGQKVTYMRRRNAEEMRSLLEDDLIDLKSEPFFGWVENRTICTNMYLAESAVSRDLQSQLLADAIPAESLPAGFVSVPKWNSLVVRNFDMSSWYKDSTRLVLLPSKLQSWGHSYFLKVPYMVVHRLYEDINTRIKEIQR